MVMQRLFTVKEASEALHVSPSLAVDCYGREDGLYCGVFCMPLGKMHFILDEPCDDRSQRTKEKKETTK